MGRVDGKVQVCNPAHQKNCLMMYQMCVKAEYNGNKKEG